MKKNPNTLAKMKNAPQLFNFYFNLIKYWYTDRQGGLFNQMYHQTTISPQKQSWISFQRALMQVTQPFPSTTLTPSATSQQRNVLCNRSCRDHLWWSVRSAQALFYLEVCMCSACVPPAFPSVSVPDHVGFIHKHSGKFPWVFPSRCLSRSLLLTSELIEEFCLINCLPVFLWIWTK